MQSQGLGSRHLPEEALSFPRAGGRSWGWGCGLSQEQAGGSYKGIDRGILKDRTDAYSKWLLSTMPSFHTQGPLGV